MPTSFAFLDFGAPELIVILAIVLVLFGSKKLPELSRGIGESIRELRKAASGAGELHQEVKSQVAQTKDSLTNPEQHEA